MTQFSDTTNRDGIIELIERNTGTQSATSASYPLKQKTVDVNDALGNYFLIAIKSGGRFQVDDTNQTNVPVITTDLVSGTKDYSYVNDGSTPANQILDLRQVRIKDNNGKWITINPIDRQVDDINKYEGQTGIPTAYDISANEIIFYPTPNYNSTGGIEFYISRTPSYFLSTDTTKEAGIPKLFQSYLYIRPSYLYCLIKNLPQTKGLQAEVVRLESAIADYYSGRNKIEKPALKVKNNDTR